METLTIEAVHEKYWTPEWVRDAVFYQIFPDRFAAGKSVPKPHNLEPWGSAPTPRGFQGGDLLGIAEHLDYLTDLGVTALYLNPIFTSASNHRYHTHDYYQVDPLLGGNQALDFLLRQAHRRGMRIILDGVFNHTGRSFHQFSSILENGLKSPYLDWFHVESWPLRPYGPPDLPAGYASWWDNRELPKLNTYTAAVREFLWDVGQYWVERGVDGWRLDVPNEIDDDAFWREFRCRVKSVNPDAYIVGEIWGDARRWLRGDQFDAVTNYLFTRAALGFFAASGKGIDEDVMRGSGLENLVPLDAVGFSRSIEELLKLYPWTVTLSQLNLLGSHDMPRLLSVARGDESAVRLAVLFQMTFPGAPCIYYGDEIGLEGAQDPDCRRAFPWDREAWNHDLHTYVRRCIALHHAHPVLRRGDFQTLYATGNTLAYARRLDEEIAIIAINAGHEEVTIDLPTSIPPLMDGACVFGSTPQLLEGQIRRWRLPPRAGDVLLASAVDAVIRE